MISFKQYPKGSIVRDPNGNTLWEKKDCDWTHKDGTVHTEPSGVDIYDVDPAHGFCRYCGSDPARDDGGFCSDFCLTKYEDGHWAEEEEEDETPEFVRLDDSLVDEDLDDDFDGDDDEIQDDDEDFENDDPFAYTDGDGFYDTDLANEKDF